VVATKAHGSDYMGSGYSYGSFGEMVDNLDRALSSRPYIAGDVFSAADTQIGSGIHYAMDILQVLPDRSAFKSYMERLQARPAFQRYAAKDAAAAQGA
jgi:glutathione S-transferase